MIKEIFNFGQTRAGRARSRSSCCSRSSPSWRSTSAGSAPRRRSDDRRPATGRRAPPGDRAPARPRLAPAAAPPASIVFLIVDLADPDDRPAGQLVPARRTRHAVRLVDRDLPAQPSSRSTTTPTCWPRQSIAAGFVNSLFIAIPATIIPIMVAAFAAYAFAWMKFPGRNILFVVVVGLLVVPLQSTFIPLLQLFGPQGPRHRPGSFLVGVAGPHRVRPAVRDLPAAQLHGRAAARGLRVGGDRRGQPGDGVLPARAADDACRRSPRWRSSSSCSSGTTSSSPSSTSAPRTRTTCRSRSSCRNLVSSLGGGWQYLAAAAFISMAAAARGLLRAPALLRPRHRRRVGQGVTAHGRAAHVRRSAGRPLYPVDAVADPRAGVRPGARGPQRDDLLAGQRPPRAARQPRGGRRQRRPRDVRQRLLRGGADRLRRGRVRLRAQPPGAAQRRRRQADPAPRRRRAARPRDRDRRGATSARWTCGPGS